MPPHPDNPGPILVTGATGRVGQEVLGALAGRAECRPTYSRLPPVGGDERWTRLDLLDASTFGAALDGVAAIFMMRPPQITERSKVRPFLAAARRLGIRRLVFLSVKGADTNPLLPHHGMERLIDQLGFDWTHVRPSDFMQNLETEHLSAIVAKGEIAVPAGNGRSAFIDVGDVGAVVSHCLLTPGHVQRGYTLTGPEALNFNQIAAILTETMRRPIRYRRISLPRFVLERREQGTPLGLCLVMAALYTVQRLGGAAETTNTVRQLLGRAPTDFAIYAGRQFRADQ